MIDFEEELKNFHPITEMDEIEDAIYERDITDMADVLVDIIKEIKEE